MSASPFIKQFAKAVSYVLHPLFMPLYLTALLIYGAPQLFTQTTAVQNVQLLFSVLLNLVFFPALTLFLLKQLKLVKSYYLETQKERIVPIFATTVFAFWVWAFVLYKNPTHYPWPAMRMGLAFFLGSSLTLVCNAFYKISLHAIGAGMLCGLVLGLFLFSHVLGIGYIAGAVAIAALIIAARRIAGNHSVFELYSGFMLGFLIQFVFQLI